MFDKDSSNNYIITSPVSSKIQIDRACGSPIQHKERKRTVLSSESRSRKKINDSKN